MPLHSEITNCENQLYTAIRNNDIALLDLLLHDDLLFHLPNGLVITKAMDLETYASGNVKVSAITASELQISPIADTAVVSVRISLAGTYLGQPMDGDFRYLRIWKKFAESWQVIAGSCIPL